MLAHYFHTARITCEYMWKTLDINSKTSTVKSRVTLYSTLFLLICINILLLRYCYYTEQFIECNIYNSHIGNQQINSSDTEFLLMC